MMFRRVEPVAGWWSGSDFSLYDAATNQRVAISTVDMQLLGALDVWRTAGELAAACRLPPRTAGARLRRLAKAGIVETSTTVPSRARRALRTWEDWSPAATLFHFSTKDTSYAPYDQATEQLRLWSATEPIPPALKKTRGRRTLLPPFERRGAFPAVLLGRRSWRRFGTSRVTRQQLATLLGLTWGVQRWMQFGTQRLALKTSPSGGALHSLEAYVAVRRIAGLESRVYHYDPEEHALVALPRRRNDAWITRCLAGQDYFADADAVVFMTSVFERVQWKYRVPRAYRVVLLEAGHFCQTFCLTATWLGLAPFCTAALSDSTIERGLGIDGVRESVLYAMGVGTRPRGTAWAPMPDGARPPALTLPAHRRKW